ncbi:hypothetical protein [Nocardioides ferulae]|uniref:hypothetical protein n=1 Tax=Nocardioides ferulae TaxID=2340821 RepID=UPI000F87FBBA|nr:hypothetical protein [Nocardioides ferulae]
MSTDTGVRAQQSPRTAAVAGAATFVPIVAVAYLAWQILEDGRETLTRSDFAPWLLVTAAVAVVTCATTALLWRRGRIGVALGAVLAVLAIVAGLAVDLVSSGGLA